MKKTDITKYITCGNVKLFNYLVEKLEFNENLLDKYLMLSLDNLHIEISSKIISMININNLAYYKKFKIVKKMVKTNYKYIESFIYSIHIYKNDLINKLIKFVCKNNLVNILFLFLKYLYKNILFDKNLLDEDLSNIKKYILLIDRDKIKFEDAQ